jgi:chloride channel 7
MTISITVLVMETTGSMQLIIPLMLTIFTAKAVGDRYGHGIYDTHIKIRGAPFLEEPELAGPTGDKLRVNEVMSDELVTLQPVMRVKDLLQILTQTPHGAYPVTEHPPAYAGEDFELHGSITRNLLLKMLLHRISFVDASGGGRVGGDNLFTNPRERDDLLEQLKQIPFKVPSAREVAHRVSEEDIRTMSVDLRSFMQRHPFLVHADARVSRAYRQFRTMGLRHMYVMPSRPRVVGLLTRKDIIQERTSLTLGLYARGLARPPARPVSRTSEPPHDARDAAVASTATALTPSAAIDDDDDAKLPYIPYYANNSATTDDGDDAAASARASHASDLDAARASNPFIDAASTLRRR